MDAPAIKILDRAQEGDQHHVDLHERDPRMRGPTPVSVLAREIRVSCHTLRIWSDPIWLMEWERIREAETESLRFSSE